MTHDAQRANYVAPYYDDGTVTIYHGDCLEILPALGTEFALVSDPPYGIDFQYFNRRRRGKINDAKTIANDAKAFDPSHLLAYPSSVLFGANYYADKLPLGKWVVWNKRDQREKASLFSDAELVWHNGSGATVSVFNWFWVGYYKKGEMGTSHHPAQKPISLMRYLIERVEGTVLDPYMGSGSTLLAARDLGRKAVGIEIEERYCEIAVRRLSQEVLAV